MNKHKKIDGATKLVQLHTPKETTGSRKKIIPLAEEGSAEAQHMIGVIYEEFSVKITIVLA